MKIIKTYLFTVLMMTISLSAFADRSLIPHKELASDVVSAVNWRMNLKYVPVPSNSEKNMMYVINPSASNTQIHFQYKEQLNSKTFQESEYELPDIFIWENTSLRIDENQLTIIKEKRSVRTEYAFDIEHIKNKQSQFIGFRLLNLEQNNKFYTLVDRKINQMGENERYFNAQRLFVNLSPLVVKQYIQNFYKNYENFLTCMISDADSSLMCTVNVDMQWQFLNNNNK